MEWNGKDEQKIESQTLEECLYSLQLANMSMMPIVVNDAYSYEGRHRSGHGAQISPAEIVARDHW